MSPTFYTLLGTLPLGIAFCALFFAPRENSINVWNKEIFYLVVNVGFYVSTAMLYPERNWPLLFLLLALILFIGYIFYREYSFSPKLME
jgi:hypothetical protein